MKLNESQLRKLVRLILEEEILDEDEIEEEDEVEEASVTGMVAGVTTPLGAGPEYPKRTPRRRRKYNIYEGAAGTATPYQVKSDADFAGSKQHVKDFINDLAKLASLIHIGPPIVTDAKRTMNSQVRIMAKNWFMAGGSSSGKGLAYLLDIYGKYNGKHMPPIDDIFKANLDSSGRVTSTGIKRGEEYLKNNRVFISNHIYGNAVDLAAKSMSDPIVQLVKLIEKTGKYEMKLVDETDQVGKHLHVKVAGKRNDEPILKLLMDPKLFLQAAKELQDKLMNIMNNIGIDFPSVIKAKTQPKGGEVLKIPGDKTWEYKFEDHWWTRKQGANKWISLKNNSKAIGVLEKEFGKRKA